MKEISELPEGTTFKTEKVKGRTVLRVQLPPGSGPVTRAQKKVIKALVRKQVKLEKKKAKGRIINAQSIATANADSGTGGAEEAPAT